jgi:hypothetical protein
MAKDLGKIEHKKTIAEWEKKKRHYELWHEYLKLSSHYKSLCKKVKQIRKKSVEKGFYKPLTEIELSVNRFFPRIPKEVSSYYTSAIALSEDDSKESLRAEFFLLEHYYPYFGNIISEPKFDASWDRIMDVVRVKGLREGYLSYPDHYTSVSYDESTPSIKMRIPVYIDLGASKQKLKDDFNSCLEQTYDSLKPKVDDYVKQFPFQLHENIKYSDKIQTYLKIYKDRVLGTRNFNTIAIMHEIKYAAAKEGFYKAKRILENVETGEFPGTYSR